jgi:hypothetical protein
MRVPCRGPGSRAHASLASLGPLRPRTAPAFADGRGLSRTHVMPPLPRPPRLSVQVWRVILFVVQNNRDILEYRHIDQIVLAAIYGVCKIHGTDVTFKDLVSAYKKLPNATSDTWLKVPLAKPGAVGNIINFYNDVSAPA